MAAKTKATTSTKKARPNGNGRKPSRRNGQFSATRKPLHEARHVPGDFYESQDVFDREKKNIFMKDWLCVGRAEEVEKPGDYMTFRVMGEPVLVVRNAAGTINAFANVCRHRGVEVAHGQGNAKEFACPYHAWLYDLDGKLVGAPYMQEVKGFDFKNCRLPELRLDLWAGWMFITFDPKAAPLSEFIAEFDDDFGILNQEECRLFDKEEAMLDCNWKLVVENLMDVYHIKVLHIDNFGKHHDLETFPFELKSRGGYSSFFNAAPDTESGKSLFGKAPWLEDQPESFGCTGFLSPNMHIFARIDEVHPMISWPVAPNKTQVNVYHLFPKPFFEQPGFEQNARKYRDFVLGFVEEDRWMVTSLQNAMGSEMFSPGPMSRLEVNLHSFINYNIDRIYGEK